MLVWRILVSAILIPLLVVIFHLDAEAGPHAPYLLILCVLVALRSVWELGVLLRCKPYAPNITLVAVCTVAVILGGWTGTLGVGGPHERAAGLGGIALAYAFSVMICGFWRAMVFQNPGFNTETLATEVFMISYVGVLVSVTAQLRWVAGDTAGYLALGSLVVAAKSGDIGAYTFGRLFGRRKMAPRLSPGKTWMGALGALVFAMLGGVAWLRVAPPLIHHGWKPCSWHWAAVYGLAIGVAGIIGDLCESLIKRDTEHKDAARLFPGFGGLLDLLDSVIYSGPVAYALWKLLPLTADFKPQIPIVTASQAMIGKILAGVSIGCS